MPPQYLHLAEDAQSERGKTERGAPNAGTECSIFKVKEKKETDGDLVKAPPASFFLLIILKITSPPLWTTRQTFDPHGHRFK